MEKILCFLNGYVEVLICGGQTERFFNLCMARGIVVRNLRQNKDKSFTCIFSVNHFFLLGPIRRKTKVRIHILEKQGLPFWVEKGVKRKAFFLGFFLCGMLLLMLSGRIWNIHIEGNVRNSTGEILDFLDKQDINHGMSKKKINCSEVAAAVRKNFPEITWVSARIEGTRLILNIQEGIIPQKTNSNTSPCNLLADKDGVITDMIVRRGIPVKKPGDSCKKGELLVSGELHIMNDSQEVLRKEYVHADADIFISRQISYYQEFPLKYRTEIPAGKKKKEMYFRFGHWYLGLYPALHTGQKRITEEIPLRITENFILPVWIGWTETTDYTVKEETYTRKEAEKEAVRRFHQYEKKLLQNGIKISENHITTRLTESLCITGGTLLIIEQTGEKSRIT